MYFIKNVFNTLINSQLHSQSLNYKSLCLVINNNFLIFWFCPLERENFSQCYSSQLIKQHISVIRTSSNIIPRFSFTVVVWVQCPNTNSFSYQYLQTTIYCYFTSCIVNKIHKNNPIKKSPLLVLRHILFPFFYLINMLTIVFLLVFIIKMSHESAKHQSALFIYVICRSIKETTELILILPSKWWDVVVVFVWSWQVHWPQIKPLLQ